VYLHNNMKDRLQAGDTAGWMNHRTFEVQAWGAGCWCGCSAAAVRSTAYPWALLPLLA
jgi:hypothetical protein